MEGLQLQTGIKKRRLDVGREKKRERESVPALERNRYSEARRFHGDVSVRFMRKGPDGWITFRFPPPSGIRFRLGSSRNEDNAPRDFFDPRAFFDGHTPATCSSA